MNRTRSTYPSIGEAESSQDTYFPSTTPSKKRKAADDKRRKGVSKSRSRKRDNICMRHFRILVKERGMDNALFGAFRQAEPLERTGEDVENEIQRHEISPAIIDLKAKAQKLKDAKQLMEQLSKANAVEVKAPEDDDIPSQDGIDSIDPDFEMADCERVHRTRGDALQDANDTITAVKAELEKFNIELQQARDGFESVAQKYIADMKADYDQKLETECSTYGGQINAMRNEHKLELNIVRSSEREDFKAKLKTREEDFDGRLQQAARRNQTDLDTARQAEWQAKNDLTKQLRETQTAAKTELSKVKAVHVKELEAQRGRYKKKLQDLSKEKESTERDLRTRLTELVVEESEKHQDAISNLRAELTTEANDQLESYRAKASAGRKQLKDKLAAVSRERDSLKEELRAKSEDSERLLKSTASRHRTELDQAKSAENDAKYDLVKQRHDLQESHDRKVVEQRQSMQESYDKLIDRQKENIAVTWRKKRDQHHKREVVLDLTLTSVVMAMTLQTQQLSIARGVKALQADCLTNAKSRIEGLSSELHEVQGKEQRLNTQLNDLKTQISNKNREITELKESKCLDATTIKQLKSSRSSMVEDLAKQKKTFAGRKLAFESQMSAADSTRLSRESQIRRLEEKITGHIDTRKRETLSFQQNLQREKNLLKQLEVKIDTQSTTISANKAQIKGLDATITSQSGMISDTKAQIQGHEATIISQSKTILNDKVHIEGLEGTLKFKSMMILDNTTRIDDLTKAKSEADVTVSSQTQRIAELSNAKSRAEDLLAERDAEIISKSESIASQRRWIRNVEEAKSAVSNQLAERGQELQLKDLKIEEDAGLIKELKATVANANLLQTKQSREVESAKLRINELLADQERHKQSQDSVISKQRGRINELQADLSTRLLEQQKTSELLANLLGQVKDAEQRIGELSTDLKQAEARYVKGEEHADAARAKYTTDIRIVTEKAKRLFLELKTKENQLKEQDLSLQSRVREICELKNEIRQKDKDSSTARSEANVKVEKLEGDLASMTQLLKKEDASNASLHEKIQQLEKARAQICWEKVQANNEASRLQVTLVNSNSEAQRIQEDLKSANVRLREKEQHLEEVECEKLGLQEELKETTGFVDNSRNDAEA